MRLIDAEKIDFKEVFKGQSDFAKDTREAAQSLLDAQPTVEREPKWTLCSERLPDEPEENPVFENKRLELYLVSVKYTDYPFRAFWNGKFFTEGWSKLENVIAWMPLPEPYKLN